MPLTTETTPDCMGIVHVGTGTITGEDFVGATSAALQLVQNTQNFHYEFVDLNEATQLQINEEHLQQITTKDRLAAVFRPNAVVVIVAPRDDFFELGKQWERRVRDLGWNTHIARERGEALDWLRANFPPPPREKLEAEIDSASAIESDR